MTTDNRTNEPTEAQVEAAAKAVDTHWPVYADPFYCSCGYVGAGESQAETQWDVEKHVQRIALVAAQEAAPQPIGRLDLARHYWRSQGYDYDLHGQDGNSDYEMGLEVADAALAALAAAQGAAPQAESEELAWYKVAAKHSADSMAEARATLQMFADRVDPFVFDELSSVLDDQPLDYETGDVIGEVAPVLPSSGVDEDKLAEVIWQEQSDRALAGYVIHTRTTARSTARAVAEWLKGQGGESRGE